tara:strand:- start:222 stop:692 length:471 start_codon:yes stop_codon:yes gene_type:complete
MDLKKLNTAVLIGLLASIVFILLQPLFGMSTLTSRHASAYIESGNYSEIMAAVLAWAVHISVSVFYAVLASVIYNINASYIVSFVQIVVLGWLTTLIATPANEWVIKLVTTGQYTAISALSNVNTDVGPKLWLHIMFFVLVILGLSLARPVAKKQR